MLPIGVIISQSLTILSMTYQTPNNAENHYYKCECSVCRKCDSDDNRMMSRELLRFILHRCFLYYTNLDLLLPYKTGYKRTHLLLISEVKVAYLTLTNKYCLVDFFVQFPINF